MAYFIIQNNCTACGDFLDVFMNGAIVDFMDEIHVNPIWCAAMCYENAIRYDGLNLEKDINLQQNTEARVSNLLADLTY